MRYDDATDIVNKKNLTIYVSVSEIIYVTFKSIVSRTDPAVDFAFADEYHGHEVRVKFLLLTLTETFIEKFQMTYC